MAMTWYVGISWAGDALLLETGDYLLLETGDRILLGDDATIYTDEAAYAIPPLQITRGRKDQFETIQAGKLTLTLDNSTRRFDAWNASSAIYPNVKPRRRIKIALQYDNAEYVTNGGMESGDPPTGWTDLNSTLVSDAVEYHGGAASMHVTVTTGGGAGAYQDFAVTPGAYMTFTGWKKSRDAASGTYFSIQDRTNLDYLYTGTPTADPVWERYSYTFLVPDTCEELRVLCRVENAGDEAWFDDVSLTGATVDLFHGRIEDIRPSGGIGSKRVTITAYDGWKDFAGHSASIALQESITAVTALGLLLDDVGWPAGASFRDLDVGNDTLSYWWCNQAVRPAIESLAESEWGAFWITNEGKAEYMNRTAYITGTSDGTLDESEITDIEISQPWDLIRNVINVKCRPVSLSTGTDEFIPNGDMEVGDPPEEWITSNSVAAAYAVDPHAGTQAVSVAASANDGLIYQTLDCIAGDAYSFSGWSKGSAAGHKTRFRIRDQSNGAWIYEGVYADNSGAWTEDTDSFTAPAGCVRFRIYCEVETNGETGYFDDVTLTGPGQVIWQLAETGVSIVAGATLTLWGEYYDAYNQPAPAKNVLAAIPYEDYTANAAADGSGADMTQSMSIVTSIYSQAAKMVISNTHGATTLYITKLQMRGKAITQTPVTIKKEDADSQDDFGNRTLPLDVEWQQSVLVADSLGDLLIGFYADPLRAVTVRMEQQFPAMLLYDIMDRITFTSDTYELYEVFRLGYMDLSTKGSMQALQATWHLEPCDNEAYWILGAADSELGVNTRLGV